MRSFGCRREDLALRCAAKKLTSKLSGGIHDRQNLEGVASNAVNDSIGWLEHFAKRGITQLRDDTPGQREVDQPINRSNDPFGNYSRIPR